MGSPEITLSEEGITIHGKRTLIFGGEMHYMRIPLELYEDRIRKAKAAGLNAIATYIPWNYHEPKEGVWTAENEKRLISFIESTKKLGLFLIARIGPYICSEWDSGGFPSWVLTRCYPRRYDDEEYRKLVEEWYSKIIKVLKKYIFPDGPIIGIQVENEYWWGDPDYILWLYELLEREGIKIPIFTNENVACRKTQVIDSLDLYPIPWDFDSPIKALEELKNSVKGKPYTIMELEGGQYASRLGRLPTNWGNIPPKWTESLLKILVANGASIINIYMFHGGTNPVGYTGKGIISSYDYEAAIREWGGLSPRYYRVKLAINILKEYEEVLLTGKHKEIGVINGVYAKIISSDRGNVVLLHNKTSRRRIIEIKEPPIGPITLEPYEVRLLPYNIRLDGLMITANQELIFIDISKEHYLMVFYGRAGEELRVKIKGMSTLLYSDVKVSILKDELLIEDIFPDGISVVKGKSEDREVLIYLCEEKDAEKLFRLGKALISGAQLAIGEEKEKKMTISLLLKEDSKIDIFPIMKRPTSVKEGDKEIPFKYDSDKRMLSLDLKYQRPRVLTNLSNWTVRIVNITELSRRGGEIQSETRLEEAGFLENGIYLLRGNLEVPHVWGRDIIITNIVDEADIIINGKYIGRVVGAIRLPAPDYLELGSNEIIAILECVGRDIEALKILNGIGGAYLVTREDLSIDRVRYKETEIMKVSTLKGRPEEVTEDYDDSKWNEAELPLEKSVEYRGKRALWIRAKAEIRHSKDRKGVLLELEGEGDFWVYINGKYVKFVQLRQDIHGYNYGRAYIDVGEYIKDGRNIIAIYAERWWWGNKHLRIKSIKLIDYIAKINKWIVRPLNLIDALIYGTERPCNMPDYESRSLVRLYECKVIIDGMKPCLTPMKLVIKNITGKGIIFFNKVPIGRYSTDSPQGEFYIPDNLISKENLLQLLHIGREPFLAHITIEPYELLDKKDLELEFG